MTDIEKLILSITMVADTDARSLIGATTTKEFDTDSLAGVEALCLNCVNVHRNTMIQAAADPRNTPEGLALLKKVLDTGEVVANSLASEVRRLYEIKHGKVRN